MLFATTSDVESFRSFLSKSERKLETLLTEIKVRQSKADALRIIVENLER